MRVMQQPVKSQQVIHLQVSPACANLLLGGYTDAQGAVKVALGRPHQRATHARDMISLISGLTLPGAITTILIKGKQAICAKTRAKRSVGTQLLDSECHEFIWNGLLDQYDELQQSPAHMIAKQRASKPGSG